jgi:TRAP-type mannitol/chloroaromatic compound transport system permease small subunit
MNKNGIGNTVDRVIEIIDRISIWSGKAVAWLIVPMFTVLAFEVLMRKFFHPTLWATDIAMMVYGTHFFIAGAFTLQTQQHIRTDFLSNKWSVKTQITLDLIQYIVFFIPAMVLFAWVSWHYAAHSWAIREVMMTSWEPPAYLYKAVIPLSTILLCLQGLSEIVKSIKALRTGVDYRNLDPERAQL